MTLAVLIAYMVGAWAGLIAPRRPWLASAWPRMVRLQVLAGSWLLSLSAAWRLQGVADLLWPGLIAAVLVVLLAIAWAVTPSGDGRSGRAALRAWAASPNTGFFVIPIAAILVGSAGVVIGTLADRLGAAVLAFSTWLLRRDAPIPQLPRTSWIDQSPMLTLLVGLGLNLVSDPPAWTETVTLWAAPVLAGSGAAVFIGSALHPSQRISTDGGRRILAILVAARIALLAPIVLLAPTPAVAVVAVLCALSIPAFMPAQLSTVYGYADPVVAAAARFGWGVGIVGVIAAVALAI